MQQLRVVGSEKEGASERLAARIAAEESRGLLRFLTCGSVDDGKSTLIGRLLYDSALVFEDQLQSVQRDSKRPSANSAGEIDLSLLVDGLQAEREQGITIDVAYRYFSTPRRKFIVADTPGHVQYTRNMATGASNCDFAVLLVDARQGVLTQTRRHACILSLLGIKKVAVAVNKMDLIDFDQARFEAIAEEFAVFA
jgi:bifunctional enzyme CysN/CysC